MRENKYSIAPRIPPGQVGIVMGCGPKINPTQCNPSQLKAGCMGFCWGDPIIISASCGGHPGFIWAYLGVVGAHLDPSGGHSGDIWTHRGDIWAIQGFIWGRLGSIWGTSGSKEGPLTAESENVEKALVFKAFLKGSRRVRRGYGGVDPT